MSRIEQNRFASRSLLRIGLAAIVFTLAGPVLAGASPWYLVGKLGQASAEGRFGSEIQGWQLDGEESATSLEVGYQLNPYFALQAGFHDLGEYRAGPRPCPRDTLCPLNLTDPAFQPIIVPDHPASAEITGFSVSAVPRLPVTERFAVYAKVGVFEWETDLAPIFPGQRLDEPSGTEFLAGLGAGYRFSRGLSLHLEVERTDLVESASLGAGWRF